MDRVELDEMMDEGLITLERVRVIAYRHNSGEDSEHHG